MQVNRGMVRTAGLAMAILAALGTRGVYAQHEHHHAAAAAPAAAPHGGTLAAVDGQSFEVVFTRDGVTLYPLTAELKSADASGLSGKVTFYHPNAPQIPWFDKPIVPVASTSGQKPDALGLKVSLATAPATGAKAIFDVQGLSKPVHLAVPVTFTAAAALAVAPATVGDKPAIDAQRKCPISGEDLMAMGGPLKVSQGDRAVFICCQGCLKAIKADPAKYLAGAAHPASGHEHHH
jgi:hypothetical protein